MRIIESIDNLPPALRQRLVEAHHAGLVRYARGGLLDYGRLSAQIRGVYTAEQVDQVAARGLQMGLTDAQITDFLEMGSIAKTTRTPPTLSPEDVVQQMQNWVTEVRPRGFPYLFTSRAQLDEFTTNLRGLITKYEVPQGRVVLQGSSLRTPSARDIDIAIFVSDTEFAQYAARCEAGLLRRTGPRARERIVETFRHNRDRGFINQFHFDRPVPGTFSSEARQSLATALGREIEDTAIDVSVMRESSFLALYPSLPL